MQRLLRLCFLQVILISIVSFSTAIVAAEQGGIRIRGPKASDAFPYDQYGPLTNKDTLWNIALKVRPDPRLTVYQVMTALYQNNPQAFKENNLNHLVNGQYLKIPDIEQIRAINPSNAKQKSEADDTVWESKVKKVASKKAAVKPEELAVKRKDLDAATSEINEKLKTIDSTQEKRLETIQNDVLDSIDGLQALLQENERLKGSLSNFNEQLDVMHDEVAKGQEIKQQMDNLLVNQQELLEKANAREQELLLEKQKAELERQNFANSPWMTVILATIPALLIIGLIAFFLMRTKSAPASEEVPKKEKTKTKENKADPEEKPKDDTLDLTDDELSLDDTLELDDEISLDDELSIDLVDDLDDSLEDLLDDDVIQLDDDLEEDTDLENDSLDQLDDIALDDNTEDLPSNELAQDDLDALLSGMNDETKDKSDESNAKLDGELDQSDLDDLLAVDTDEVDIDDIVENNLPEPEPEPELEPDDIDAILAGEDPLVDENDELTDPDDIDALLAGVESDTETETPAEPEAQIDNAQAELTDPDDIDALLAGVESDTKTETPAEPEAQIDDAQAELTDPDDIDALLAGVESDTETPAEPEAQIDDTQAELTDPDDIDALLAGVESDSEAETTTEPEAQIDDAQAELTDPDDIDALLAGVESDNEAETTAEPEAQIDDVQAELTDPDDIDALLADIESDTEAETPAEPEAQIDDAQAELTDPDDIDALLADIESDTEAETPAEPEAQIDDAQAELTDPDDIDALLADIESDAEVETPAEPEAQIDDAQAELTDPDDIDALLADIESDAEVEIPAEPEGQIDDAQAELTDPDDIDALLADFDTPESIDVAVGHEEDIDKQVEKLAAESEEDELAINTELINNLSEDKVTPLLSMDFSDISVNSEHTEESITPDVSDIIEEPVDINDDIDLDALLAEADLVAESEVSSADDEEASLEIDETVVNDNDKLEADIDDLLLSEEFTEESLKELNENIPAELTPDFTDSNVLADLLNDDTSEKKEIVEANELEDIQELDDLDFDELLANIEEETSKPSAELNDEFDIGDDLDDEIQNDQEIEELLQQQDEKPEDDFLSVDSLLSDSLEINMVDEPYERKKIDVGLEDFPEFGHQGNSVDVDDEDESGIAAKLDLAKVYIEIGDIENGEVILLDVIDKGDAQQQYEAQQLLDNLK